MYFDISSTRLQRQNKVVTWNSSDNTCRGGSRAAARSKMECFVIIVHGLQPLTNIIKHSILDVAAALDPPLEWVILIWIFAVSCLISKVLSSFKIAYQRKN